MQTLEELQTIAEELKLGLPSFSSAPITGELAGETGLIGVINIESGDFKGYKIGIKHLSIESGDVRIEYSALNPDKEEIKSDPKLEAVIGALIEYFMATTIIAEMTEGSE